MKLEFEIHEELEPHAADIQAFLNVMSFKLRMNKHKDNDYDRASMLWGLVNEVEEVLVAPGRGDMIVEAADVANMALLFGTKFMADADNRRVVLDEARRVRAARLRNFSDDMNNAAELEDS